MLSDDVIIHVDSISKGYQIYENPVDRLKQFILPRLQGLFGLNVKQYFKEFWALRDISFEIKTGEILGIVGKNGSGKSTLLQLIAGTITPTKGNVQVRGKTAAILELGSGFNPDFTGIENIYLYAAVYGLNKEQIDEKLSSIQEFADIGDFIYQPMKTYSSGMIVRLAFAVIAHLDVEVLVIDEALAVGDIFFVQKCMRYIKKFMETGTVIFVSHDTGMILNLCTKAILLNKGEVIDFGSPKDVCEHYLKIFFEQPNKQEPDIKKLSKSHEKTNKNVIDSRSELRDSNSYRNDIFFFDFDPSAKAFGGGGARIITAAFYDEDEAVLPYVMGGEEVMLKIEIEIEQDTQSAIVGFFMKDRFGQYLFGDNTYLTYRERPVVCPKGQRLEAVFEFMMPRLKHGDYTMDFAIADGTQDEHIQHHWIHDALAIRSEGLNPSCGLIGIPMTDITLRKID